MINKNRGKCEQFNYSIAFDHSIKYKAQQHGLSYERACKSETIGKCTVNTPSSVTSHSQRGKECSDSPDLQTAKLQCHPVTDFTGMILHVITTHL